MLCYIGDGKDILQGNDAKVGWWGKGYAMLQW